MTRRNRYRRDSGQASIELLALLPVLGVLTLIGAQAALIGQAWWLTRSAANAAARAQAVGQPVRQAALGVLPDRLEQGLRVDQISGGRGVRVLVRLPAPVGLQLGMVSAEAQMRRQR